MPDTQSLSLEAMQPCRNVLCMDKHMYEVYIIHHSPPCPFTYRYDLEMIA